MWTKFFMGKMIEKLGEISILRVMTSAFLSKCQVQVQYFPLQCEPVKGSIGTLALGDFFPLSSLRPSFLLRRSSTSL
jgi:Na+-transporting NADH:ubiquinone oxidoreductase subunit NqrB